MSSPGSAGSTGSADSVAEDIRYLRDPRSIRERAELLFDRLARGDSEYLEYHPEKLPAVARLVAQVTKESYPSLNIPYHARENHFRTRASATAQEPGVAALQPGGAGVGRLEWLLSPLGRDLEERARSEFDLTLTSVLLDAGAGAEWSYVEPGSGERYARSEGLAIASLYWFKAGAFSSNPQNPLRADAAALKTLTLKDLQLGFGVTEQNPLVGLEGRLGLLHALGDALQAHPDLFPNGRVGDLFDSLLARREASVLRAEQILHALLEGLSSIWPGRESLGGTPLGDVWRHTALMTCERAPGLIPFHKLSQWLSYSLVVPLERAGVPVLELDSLTGLPEYRNGGLFLDGEVLTLRDAELAAVPHRPGSELIVEWRAATVVLLDQVAQLVRKELGVSREVMPLARVLEGGTWAAGRRLAAEKRAGLPPLELVSDGTVF